MERKVYIGITGKIGSGKSTLARQFSEDGIKVFDTDHISKFIMRNDETIKKVLIDTLGDESFYMLDGVQTLNSKYVASIIFTDPEKKKIIEGVVHPLVTKTIKKQIESTDDTIIAIESAILFQSGLNKKFDFDAIINVERDEEKIVDTLTSGNSSRTLNREDLLNRLANQNAGKISGYARTITVENNGSCDDLKKLSTHLANTIKSCVERNGSFIPLTQRLSKTRLSIVVFSTGENCYLPNIVT